MAETFMCRYENLYVVDSEYAVMGEQLSSHRDFLREIIEDYIKIVEFICDNNSNKGKFYQQLTAYKDLFKALPENIKNSGANMRRDCNHFVEKIDQYDEFLY